MRSDIYALGCVLYEMLTGRPMVQGRVPVQPAAIEAVVATCLEQDPDQRWQSARDVGRALRLPIVAAAPAGGSWRERAVWIGATILLAAALIYVSTATGRDNTAPVAKVTLSVNPPEKSTFVGAANVTVPVPMFALSRDGRSLAFSASIEGAKSSLWIRRLDERTARALPGTDDAQYPFWSPNSEWIAFFAEGKLKRVSSGGGPVQVVADGVPDPRGGSWGPDDTILIGGANSPLIRVASAGGVGSAVTNFDAAHNEASHRWPVWLPDARHFLFAVRSNSVEDSGVYLASLDGSRQKLSIRSDGSVSYASGHVLFLQGDTLFAQRLDIDHSKLIGQPIQIAERVGSASNGFGSFSASEAGLLAFAATLSQNGRLTWFDRAANRLGSIGEEGDYTDLRFSPDEKRLAVSLVDPKTGNADIWLADLTRGNLSRFTFGPRLNSGPVWSPDGARIVFRTSRKGGQVEFYEKSSGAGGSEVPVLLQETQRAASGQGQNVVVSDWSPDGRNLLYSLSTTARTDLWLFPLIDARKPVPFLVTQSDNMHATFSSDGHLIAYSSNETGRFEVYVQTFPLSDRKWPVSTTGGYEPRWRKDGREIFYLSEDRKLMAVPVGPGPSFGVPRQLFQTGVLAERVTAYRTHYTPNADGTRFLINTQSGDAPPTSITVVLNWTAALKN